MPQISQETRDILQALEQEAFGVVPEGVQHFVVDAPENPVTFNDEGAPRLRIGYRVQCGEHEEVFISDFIGFYPSSTSQSTKSIEQRARAAKAMALGALANIAEAADSALAADIVLDLRNIDNMDTNTYKDVAALFMAFSEGVEEMPLYCNVKKTADGRARFNYLKPDHKDAFCTCSAEKVSFS